jgi:hypothetical protein
MEQPVASDRQSGLPGNMGMILQSHYGQANSMNDQREKKQGQSQPLP